jgi:protein phosphatase
MPWSAKAQELVKHQYAAVGSAGSASLQEAIGTLERTAQRTDLERYFRLPPNSTSRPFDVVAVLARQQDRLRWIGAYQNAYRHYCWPVASVEDFRLAPFHLLATEGCVHVDKDHEWHMETLHVCCDSDPDLLISTPYRVVDLDDPHCRAESIAWWETMTSKGGEGMVVKPHAFIANDKKGLLQPAVKVRGREYLRIIYGPEYTAPEHIQRLKGRNLGRKRSLALREFALGIEALERFARREPLRRVHACVFGVLALESEPVDPRL